METVTQNKQDKSAEQVSLDEQLKEEARNFIQKHGLLLFLDICQGSLSNLLIKKGIITSDELVIEYLHGISCYQKNLNQSSF